MSRLALVIANKNYSSWSMRPWVLMRQAGIPFDEIQLQLAQDVRVIGIERHSPAGKVPVLLLDGESVWDSLAICETLAELFPEKFLWPEPADARRAARSVCAEMHSGFQALRNAMPMNVRGRHPGKGMNAEVRKDIDRIVSIWSSCRERFGKGGDLLFGRFCIADAFYAPVVMRFTTYAVALPPAAQSYADAVRGLAAVQEWTDAARRETAVVAADEPYA